MYLVIVSSVLLDVLVAKMLPIATVVTLPSSSTVPTASATLPMTNSMTQTTSPVAVVPPS